MKTACLSDPSQVSGTRHWRRGRQPTYAAPGRRARAVPGGFRTDPIDWAALAPARAPGAARRDSRHVALWKGTGNRPGDAHGDQVDPRLPAIGVGDVLAAVRGIRLSA